MLIPVICHLTVGENFPGFSGFNAPGWSLMSASDFTGVPSSRYEDGMRLVEARLRSKSDSWSQAFLTETVKTGAKYRNVSYKIFKRCRPFRERVDPPSNSIAWKRWLLYHKRQWSKKKRIVMSKTSGTLRWWGWLIGCCKNFHCMQVSHVMNMQLFPATIEMTRYVLHVFALWQWYIFSRIEPWFSYIYTRVFNQFRNNKIVENYINSKYPKEH